VAGCGRECTTVRTGPGNGTGWGNTGGCPGMQSGYSASATRYDGRSAMSWIGDTTLKRFIIISERICTLIRSFRYVPGITRLPGEHTVRKWLNSSMMSDIEDGNWSKPGFPSLKENSMVI
jgi:hypothetical protein